MKPLAADEIRGNWATLLLPIGADDAIDFGLLADEIDTLVACRVDGIYSGGTAGEFYNVTEEEFDRINALLADRAERAGVPFQIGVSHMSPTISRLRLRRAVALRPSAVQLILPDWFPVTQSEAIAFLQGMADEAAGIGLVLYNPPHAKRRLTPTEIGQLQRAVPSLVGVKVPGGNAAWYTEMRRHCTGLSVFVPGHTLASGIAQGAHGAYSNVACLHPGAAQAWYRQILSDPPAALEVEGRIGSFLQTRVVPLLTVDGYSNQAADKLLASIGGWSAVTTRLRWPYRWIAESEVARLRPMARQQLPEFFPG
jgi:4-hydroxy-tetrahydrodipicolinate synthase